MERVWQSALHVGLLLGNLQVHSYWPPAPEALPKQGSKKDKGHPPRFGFTPHPKGAAKGSHDLEEPPPAKCRDLPHPLDEQQLGSKGLRVCAQHVGAQRNGGQDPTLTGKRWGTYQMNLHWCSKICSKLSHETLNPTRTRDHP